jgi:hypothetical protein
MMKRPPRLGLRRVQSSRGPGCPQMQGALMEYVVWAKFILPGLLTAVLCGCASKKELSVPASALPVRVGQGTLDYTAEDNGNMYLLDTTTQKTVFAKVVQRDDPIIVDPSRDRILVAGAAAEHKVPLNPDHLYRLYFDKAQSMAGTP